MPKTHELVLLVLLAFEVYLEPFDLKLGYGTISLTDLLKVYTSSKTFHNMQFPRRNTLTFFAIALALVCILQMAPSARADCLKGELTEKAKGICSPLLTFLPCGIIVDHIVGIFNSVCANANVKDTSSSSTTTTTTVAPKA